MSMLFKCLRRIFRCHWFTWCVMLLATAAMVILMVPGTQHPLSADMREGIWSKIEHTTKGWRLDGHSYQHGWPLTYLERGIGGFTDTRHGAHSQFVHGTKPSMPRWWVSPETFGTIDNEDLQRNLRDEFIRQGKVPFEWSNDHNWPFFSDFQLWHWIPFWIDLLVAAAIMLIVGTAIEFWIRRRGGLFRWRLIDVIGLVTLICFVLGWQQYHAHIASSEASISKPDGLSSLSIHYTVTPRYEYTGPDWLSHLLGQKHLLHFSHHMTSMSISSYIPPERAELEVPQQKIQQLREQGARLVYLKELVLSGYSLPSPILQALEHVPNLTQVKIVGDYAQFSVNQENRPADLKKLKRLGMEELKISQGCWLLEDIEPVCSTPTLKRLELVDAAILPGEVEQLRQRYPGLTITSIWHRQVRNPKNSIYSFESLDTPPKRRVEEVQKIRQQRQRQQRRQQQKAPESGAVSPDHESRFAAALKDKFRGMLLLGGYGDSLGAPHETLGRALYGNIGTPDAARRLPTFNEYGPRAVHPWGVWHTTDMVDGQQRGLPTDDTAFRIAILHRWLGELSQTEEPPTEAGFLAWMEEQTERSMAPEATLQWQWMRQRQINDWLAMLDDAGQLRGLSEKVSTEDAADRGMNHFFRENTPVVFGPFMYLELSAIYAGCSQEEVFDRFSQFSRLDQDYGQYVTGMLTTMMAQAILEEPAQGSFDDWFFEAADRLLESGLGDANQRATVTAEFNSAKQIGVSNRHLSEVDFLQQLKSKVFEPAFAGRPKHSTNNLRNFDPLLFLKITAATVGYAGGDTRKALRMLAVAPGDADTMTSQLGSIIGAWQGEAGLREMDGELAADLDQVKFCIERYLDANIDNIADQLVQLTIQHGQYPLWDDR